MQNDTTVVSPGPVNPASPVGQSAALPHRIGKYVVQGELGRGGMGVVFSALDPLIERRVAIKTITRALLDAGEAGDMMQRFKREAQAAGRLMHPNIVAVYEYGENDEMAFIAMERVAGRSLNDMLASGEVADLADMGRVRSIAAQLLAGLQFAHGQGVVHRDIKPSNLMLTTDGTLKICDFGIAQIESSQLTQVGTMLGTPSYMSPEQIQGQATDLRADLFSAGVVVYQLLTGQKPFAGDTIPALMHAVLQGVFKAPTEVNLGLDSAFDAVLARALARAPGERFQSAAAFAQALEAAFNGEVWDGDELDVTARMATFAQSAPSVPSAFISGATPAPALRKINFAAVQKKINLDATRAGPAAAGELPRVLFVDDEERILSALKLLFRQQYEVHVATEGAQALELMAKHHFHVIVSDQRMPTMTGTELLAKARVASPDTVRILLTGYSDLAAIVGSVNEGEVYRFASKPWNTQDIRMLLADAAAIGQELELAPALAASTGKAEEAVLFLDEDREIYLAARDLLGRSYRVLHAADLAGALNALKTENVAVLVADIEDSKRSHRTFFKLLKQEHPEIVTIAMTEASDSELVIELINQARIFRFLNKPLKLATLQSHVEAAMTQFARQKAQPRLLQQQKPDSKPGAQPHAEGSVGGFILQSLRALGRRWGSA